MLKIISILSAQSKNRFVFSGLIPFDENVVKYDKLIRYQGEDTPATTQNHEPECHDYMERMISAMDGSLLIAFKICAENGTEWDGDAAYSKVFELWRMSQKIQMQDVHEDAESVNNGDDDDDKNITDGILAAEPQNVDAVFHNENTTEFMQDGTPILVFNREEDARVFIDLQGSTLVPVNCIENFPSTCAGEMVSIAATQQTDAEVAAFETFFQMLIRRKTFNIKIKQTNVRVLWINQLTL